MVKVIAKEKGFFGGQIRDIGETFNVSDEVWKDDKRRPSWVEPAKLSAEPVEPETDEHEGDEKSLEDMSVAELREVAKQRGIPLSVTRKAEIVAAIQSAGEGEAPSSEPFGDAPDPQKVESEVNKALGATEPDWVPGGAVEI